MGIPKLSVVVYIVLAPQHYIKFKIYCDTIIIKGLVQSPCGKINVIMTLGGGVLVHDVLQLHCQQILALVMIMHSCG